MKLRTHRRLLAALFFPFVLLTTSQGKEPLDLSHLFARHMNEILAGLKDTKYQAKTEVDPAKGVFRCNCSGLITHILRHHFPESYLTVRGENAAWRARPLAVTYYETFSAAKEGDNLKPGWRQVNSLLDAKPGDLIAWRKLSLQQGLNTGHIVMVAQKPTLEKDGRIKVRVVDSTSWPHANDTRPKGSRGVGAGDMWFTVNKEGRPIGYWLNETSQRSQTNRIAIGRLAPIKLATAIQPKVAPVKKPDQRPSPDLDYLGLSITEAIKLANERKIKFRTIVEDNIHQPVSKTITKDRVNFILEKGKVIRTIRG